MGRVRTLFASFFSAKDKPMIRIKGTGKRRFMLLHFPTSDDSSVTIIPASEFENAKFSLDKCGGEREWTHVLKLGERVITVFPTKDSAAGVMERIGNAIAPDRWFWPRRCLIVLFLFWFFFGRLSGSPSQDDLQRAAAMEMQARIAQQAQMAARNDQHLSASQPGNPVGQPVASGASSGEVAQAMQSTTDSEDPFGLRLDQPTK